MNIHHILKRFNLIVGKAFPRHSIRFAVEYFKGKEIDVIEIGVYKGENVESIIECLNVQSIYLVDPRIELSYRKLDGFDACEFLQMYSDDAVEKFPKVDFIYIDGDHTYEQVKKDMDNYWKKVKKGGILAGHDIFRAEEDYGVAKAFVEFCSENKLKPYISRTDWWVVKR